MHWPLWTTHMVYVGYTCHIFQKTVYIGIMPLLRYNGKAVPGKIQKRGIHPHTIVDGTEKTKNKKEDSADSPGIEAELR